MRSPRVLALTVAAVCLAATGCRRADPAIGSANQSAASPVAPITPPTPRTENGPRRDLSIDEAMGGHTLARHVGRTDTELAQRLRREQISAASTYSDRDAAERSVGAALHDGARRLRAWQERSGRRPNLVLHYDDRSGTPIGRTLFRGDTVTVPCDRALVVLRWDDRADRYYVLTSYPDCNR